MKNLKKSEICKYCGRPFQKEVTPASDNIDRRYICSSPLVILEAEEMFRKFIEQLNKCCSNKQTFSGRLLKNSLILEFDCDA